MEEIAFKRLYLFKPSTRSYRRLNLLSILIILISNIIITETFYYQKNKLNISTKSAGNSSLLSIPASIDKILNFNNRFGINQHLNQGNYVTEIIGWIDSINLPDQKIIFKNYQNNWQKEASFTDQTRIYRLIAASSPPVVVDSHLSRIIPRQTIALGLCADATCDTLLNISFVEIPQ
jgi:hypothetical protein